MKKETPYYVWISLFMEDNNSKIIFFLFFLVLGVIANDVEILWVHPKKSLKTVSLSFLLLV